MRLLAVFASIGAAVALILMLAVAAGATGTQSGPLHWSAAAGQIDHNGVSALSCPATSLCVAGSGDGLLVSTNPAGGAQSWSLVFTPPATPPAAPQVTSVSCPSTTFCAAVSLSGDLITSTEPGGGASAWTLTGVHLPIGHYPHSFIPEISCASPTLCVAISTGSPAVASSTDPTGGTGAWKFSQLSHPLTTVACTRPSLCILGDDHGDVRTSTHPTGGARTWSFAHIFGRPGSPDYLGDAACGSAHWCLISAALPIGQLLILATKPTGTKAMTPGVWQSIVAHTRSTLSSESCVGTFCAYATVDGTVYFPGRTYRAVASTRVYQGGGYPQNLGNVSCVSRSWCALATDRGAFYIGNRQ